MNSPAAVPHVQTIVMLKSLIIATVLLPTGADT
jgi:hypothetical protein